VLMARIDFKKVREEKDLSYLENWYCPLERTGERDLNPASGGHSPPVSATHLIPWLSLNRVQFDLAQKQAMAGF